MKRKTSATAKKAVNKRKKGRKQNIPAKPIVEIFLSENGVTVWWRQPDFCDWNEILFGQDLNNLKPLPKTRLSHLDIPKKDIPFDTSYWVKVRGINKAGKGEWSEPKLIRLTKAVPSVTNATKPKRFVRGW